jgi:hypothetical protein
MESNVARATQLKLISRDTYNGGKVVVRTYKEVPCEQKIQPRPGVSTPMQAPPKK